MAVRCSERRANAGEQTIGVIDHRTTGVDGVLQCSERLAEFGFLKVALANDASRDERAFREAARTKRNQRSRVPTGAHVGHGGSHEAM